MITEYVKLLPIVLIFLLAVSAFVFIPARTLAETEAAGSSPVLSADPCSDQGTGTQKQFSESGQPIPVSDASQTSSVSDKDPQEMRKNLNIVASLGKRTDLNETEQSQLHQAVDYMNTLTGRDMVVYLNSGLKDQELLESMHAVGIHAVLTGELTSRSLSLSSLGVATLLAAEEIMPEQTCRNDDKVLMIMYNEMVPRQEGSIDPICNIIGIGRNTLYRARNEIINNGLNLGTKHANATGAGRKTTNEDFAEAYTPLCNEAGLKEEDVLLRHAEAQTKEAVDAIAGQSSSQDHSSDEESVNPDMPDHFRKVSAEEEVKLISEDTTLPLGQCYSTVIKMIPTAIEEIDSLLQDNSYADSRRLTVLRSILVEIPEKITAEFSDIITEGSTSFAVTGEQPVIVIAEDTETASSGTVNFDMIRYASKCNLVRGYLKEIELTCLTIQEATAQREHSVKAAYTAIRRIETSLYPMTMRHRLKQMQPRYESVQRKIDYVERWLADRLKKQEQDVPGETGSEHAERVEKTVDREPDISAILSCLEIVNSQLDEMIRLFKEAVFTESTQNIRIPAALEKLNELKALLSEAVQNNPGNEDRPVLNALSAIIETFRSNLGKWKYLWDKYATVLSAANQVSRSILSRSFEKTLHERFKELRVACSVNAASDETTNASPDALPQSDSSLNVAQDEIHAEARLEAEQSIQTVKTLANDLKHLLLEGAAKKIVRSNSTPDHIAEAVDYLDKEMETFLKSANEIFEANDSDRLFSFKSVISGMSSYLSCILEKWLKLPDGKYSACYSTAKTVSNSVLTKRSQKKVDALWTTYVNDMERRSRWLASGDIPENFVTLDDLKSLAHEAEENGGNSLPIEKRAELIRQFWNEGKDPLDIKIWIEYIVEADCKNSYTCPSGRGKYCRLTRNELQSAFYYLTGFSCCSKTLWKILTRDMGYSRRQCAKLDQFGEKHPLADEQYANIQRYINEADPDSVLILSIDTKAQIILGKFKPDNGTLLCSPGSSSFHTYSHDFPIRIKDIYYKGTNLVDESRLDERAVLHPVGVYCKNDNSGYISLVLGKDTSESMHNLLNVVISKKKKQMPNLKKILIISDGGGSNMSNGILWPTELLHLTDEVKLPVMVAHTAPGCSKHNMIERALFSNISKHCKTKPFLDIEHTAQYISETTTHPSSGNPLKVECWFDNKRYLTNTQKKAAGEKVMTRAEFDKLAAGRIVHPFEPGTDLYKWNYTVYPRDWGEKSAA